MLVGSWINASIACAQGLTPESSKGVRLLLQERSENIGGVVGYSVRLESRMSRRTRLLFCTTGRNVSSTYLFVDVLASAPPLLLYPGLLTLQLQAKLRCNSDGVCILAEKILPQAIPGIACLPSCSVTKPRLLCMYVARLACLLSPTVILLLLRVTLAQDKVLCRTCYTCHGLHGMACLVCLYAMV